jgi:hypothetical protein
VQAAVVQESWEDDADDAKNGIYLYVLCMYVCMYVCVCLCVCVLTTSGLIMM